MKHVTIPAAIGLITAHWDIFIISRDQRSMWPSKHLTITILMGLLNDDLWNEMIQRNILYNCSSDIATQLSIMYGKLRIWCQKSKSGLIIHFRQFWEKVLRCDNWPQCKFTWINCRGFNGRGINCQGLNCRGLNCRDTWIHNSGYHD